MMDILKHLANGPVLKSPLLKGRSGRFILAYRRLLMAGKIVEHGSGAQGDRIYVGLTGAVFPERRERGLKIRKADIELLIEAGHTREEAVGNLSRALSNSDVYLRCVADAHAAVKQRVIKA
jgi:hypothetical protein